MFFNIILLFIVLVLAACLTYSKKFKEQFLDFPAEHTSYVNDSSKKFDPITNMVNLTSPALPINPPGADTVKQSLVGFDVQPTSGAYTLQPKDHHPLLPQLPDTFNKAKICEKPGRNTCAAFDDSEFSANCGISFDNKSTGVDGKVRQGGLYVSPDDRAAQTAKADMVEKQGTPPYDPYKVYQPTLGTAKPGTFSLTKDQCNVVKEKLDCASKQTFNSPNCTQCYTSQQFSRVDPKTGRMPSTLYLFGTGIASITYSSKSGIKLSRTTLSESSSTSISIPGSAEGSTFTVHVEPSANPYYIAGFLEGNTARGIFKIDFNNLIQSDTVSHAKPRLAGSKIFTGPNGTFRCFTLIPGAGQRTMDLSCLMPFSFINGFDGDNLACDNGPIITQAASATFLESDPCFGKANSKGNYKLECLQQRWISLGGSPQGTGFPTDQAKADALQKDAAGNPLDIDIIVNNLAIRVNRALTGNDASGASLSIPDWNTDSMYATGVPITNPCSGPGGTAPITQACANYLYTNSGRYSSVGPTYTQGTDKASLAGTECFIDATPTVYNQPKTTLDPTVPTGYAALPKNLDMYGAKQYYDNVNRLANDNSKTNAERAAAIGQTFGIYVPTATMSQDDFNVRIPANQPTSTYDQLKQVCESKGQRLCQSAEICDMESRQVISPELTDTFPGDNWIAVGDTPNEWLTLNRDGGRYCKTHTEVAGIKPSWGSSTNPEGWERLAKCCSGKPSVLGRYIKLQYDHPECLNLAQFEVYSDESTSSKINIPWFKVSKSSSYGQWWQNGWWDFFPNWWIVNGAGNLFTHSSCGDIPWIHFDLGGIKPIYKIVVTNRRDCCQSRILGTKLQIMNEQGGVIYESDKISTTNMTYTWYPPFKGVYADLNGEKPDPQYKSIGCWGDTGNRAMEPLEGQNDAISGGYWGRPDAVKRCYTAAKAKGLKYFGLQHNGWCCAGNDLNAATKYGPSNQCYGEGKGGPWANNVYVIGD